MTTAGPDAIDETARQALRSTWEGSLAGFVLYSTMTSALTKRAESETVEDDWPAMLSGQKPEDRPDPFFDIDDAESDAEQDPDFDRMLDNLARGRTTRLLRQARGPDPAPSDRLETAFSPNTDYGPRQRRRIRTRTWWGPSTSITGMETQAHGLRIARPPRSVLLLMVVTVVMLGLMAVLVGLAAHAFSSMVDHLQASTDTMRRPSLPEPSERDLRDPQRFAQLLQARGNEAARWHYRRGQLQAESGEHIAALESFAAAEVAGERLLPLTWRLDQAAVLIALRRLHDARQALRRVDPVALDEADRARLRGLWGRLHVADGGRSR